MEIDNEFRKRIDKNLFFQRYRDLGIKESLFSDTVGAVGHLQSRITACAYPQLIGRKIIDVQPTKLPSERWPLDSKAVAYRYAEGTATRLSGSKSNYVEINNNITAEGSDQWSKGYIEDYMTLNVIDKIVEKISQALAEDETSSVISLYGCIEDEDLAVGAPVNQGNKMMDWNAVAKLRKAVRDENWHPKILVLNNTQISQLLLDDKFIDIDALPSKETDIEEGTINQILGMKVQSSTLVPNGTAYAIDPLVASKMLLRRDVMVEDWSDIKNGVYGVKATTRFGIGVLRSNAVAKMTNIKTTL